MHDLFIESLRNLKKSYRGLKLFMATTDQHEYEEPWIIHAQHANNPLGEKWNAAVTLALADKSWKYALFLGDDDLISPQSLKQLMWAKQDYVGVKKMGFIDPVKKRAVMGNYKFPCEKLFGAGKLLTRQALEDSSLVVMFHSHRKLWSNKIKLEKDNKIWLNVRQAKFLTAMGGGHIVPDTWKVELFAPDQNQGLDYSMDSNLIQHNYHPKSVQVKDPIVDVKSRGNIWSFNRIAISKHTERCKYQDCVYWFTPEMNKLLTLIEKTNGVN